MDPENEFHDDSRKELSTEEFLYRTGWVMLPVMILMGYVTLRWIVPNLPDTECIVFKFFGVYCPGCGGTRAVIALLHGDLLKSAWYHPFVPYTVLMYVLYMLSHTMEKLHVPHVKGMLFKEWIMYGMLVMIGISFVMKNVLKFGFGILL